MPGSMRRLSRRIAFGTERNRKPYPAVCSDRDYAVSQPMLEESWHGITTGYAL
jgi:hypothetical protein